MRLPVRRWGLAACLFTAGCLSNQRFEEVAPGVSVTRKSIDEYAEKHGISRDEAKQRITAEVTSSDAADPEAKAVKTTGQKLEGQ